MSQVDSRPWVVVFNRLELDAYPYADWISSEKFRICLLTEAGAWQRALLKDPNLSHRYDHVVTFDRYPLSGRVEKAALDFARNHRVEAVAALSEMDLLRAARVRGVLGLSGGCSEETVLAFRDKVLMKERAAQKGIRSPIYRPIQTVSDVLTAAQEFGYPFVIKPRREGGSHGVTVVRSPEALDTYLDNHWIPSIDAIPDLMAEQYLPLPMLHVDGVVVEGELEFQYASHYLATCLDNREGQVGGGLSVLAGSPLAKKVSEFVQTLTTDALAERGSFAIHVELFNDEANGELFLCEAALRHGGAGIREYLQDAGGPDVARASVLGQLGLSLVDVPNLSANERYGYLIVPTRPGRFEVLPMDAPVEIVREVLFKQPGSVCPAATHSADIAAQVVFRLPVTGCSEAAPLEWAAKKYVFVTEAV